jgi:L-alanine-DL-glutamate epimerase-like enolase superfamily enzyme
MSIGEPLERNELPFIGRLMTRESRGYNSQDVKTVGEIASEYDRLLTDIKVKLSRDRNDPMVKELGAKALSIGGAYDKMVELNEMYSDVRKLRAQKKWDEADKIERKMTTEAGEFLKNPAELKGGIPKMPEKPKIGSKNYQDRMKSYWERRAVYDAITGK